MKRHHWFRGIFILLAVLMMVTMAMATTVNVLDGKISIADTANSNTLSNNVVTIKAKGSLFSKKTNTVTIKNESGRKANVSFDYSASTYNSFTIAGASANASGNYSTPLEAGAAVTIVLQSNNGLSDTTATLTLSNFTCVAAVDADITFTYDTTRGSVTLGGEAVANEATKTIGSNGGALVATPSSGYSFLGWVDGNSKLLSSSASYTLVPAEGMNSNVQAVFEKSDGTGTAWFLVDDKFLTDNLTTAGTLGSKIVLANNGTLSGSHTIASGDTLLIPKDASNTVYTTEPATSDANTLTKPTAFRTLTMASGANITVNGAISIGGTQHSAMAAGTPFGPVGFIQMNANSSITINSGANLYAWGYITGTGSVTVKSGGQVYECFQIADWRGGSATNSMLGKSEKIFPMSQYYVQNVEVPMTLEAGAKEYGFMSVAVSIVGIKTTTVSFIGTDSSMFQISGGSLTKDYDEANDRLIITLNKGNVSISPYTIKVSVGYTITINSSEYVLPITSNLTLNINSGSTVTLSQDIAFLPGSEVNIAEGANCVITNDSNIYVYDADEWETYCGDENAKFVVIGYAPGQKKTRTEADLKDAAIKVNGTVDASAGYIYTTASGANIYSDGSGTVIQRAGDKTVTYQATYKKDGYTAHEIAVTPAKLKHGNGEYVTTGTGTYNYNAEHEKWVLGEHTVTDKVSDSTCTEKGSITHTCTCGYESQEEVAAKGHTEVVDAAVAPTCTATGLTEGKHCSVCGTVTVAQTVVNASGHSYTSVTNNATCTEDGSTVYTCTVCGDSYSEPIAATGHKHTAVVTPPTCAAEGYTTYTCSACGDSYVDNKVAALGHTWTDATCMKAKTCSVCGVSEGSVLAHSFSKYSSIGGDLERAECAYGCKTTHTRVTENGVSDQDQVVSVVPETSEIENSAQVAVDKELLDDIAGDGLQMHLTSKIMTLAFDNQALNAILDSLTELVQLVEISTENITPSDVEDKMVFDIHLKVDGEKVEKSDFGVGEVTVTIPLDGLTIPTGKIGKVWHVDEAQRTDMNAVYDRKNGTVTFQTNHFSEFEVLPEVCDGHTYENGICTKCEEVQSVTYKVAQTVQIGIEEPWFLQANARIVPNGGGAQDHIDYSTLEDFGFYFVRRSQLADQSVTEGTITKEDIINNTHTLKLSKGNGAYVNGICISARYDEGLYTYEMNDGIFVLGYYVQNGETHYLKIRERVMIDIIKTEKDRVTEPEVKATYQGLSDLYDAVIAYHNGRPVLDKAQKAPTLAEYQLGAPTANGPYKLAYTIQVRTIEPWGLRFNSRIVDPNGNTKESVDYSSLDEYGVVIYYDRAEEIADTMTAEELLAREDAYVFSSLNDDIVISGNSIYATYNKDIYTYEMHKNMYVMFYYQLDGAYYYGSVKTRNILAALEETQKVVEKDPVAYDVVVSMKALNQAIVTYQSAEK